MGGCTPKWDEQCRAYRKQASLQTNASATNLHHLNITKAPTSWVCGTTNPNQSHSPLLLTILESKLLIRPTSIIWFQASNRCTQSPKIWLAIYSAESQSIGIMWTAPLTSQCQAISKRNCKSTSMWQPRNYKLAHTHLSQKIWQGGTGPPPTKQLTKTQCKVNKMGPKNCREHFVLHPSHWCDGSNGP